MTANTGQSALRVLELYAGLGGCAAVLQGSTAEVVAAVDVSSLALGVYRHNFHHPTVTASVESLSVERLTAWNADLWWLSPPCQPFTHRGKQLDLDDPRAASFPRLLERIAAVRPTYLALENVPGFKGSAAHRLLLDTLEAAGYPHRHELLLCPSELGLPNRRRRFYLVAGRQPLAEPNIEPRPPQPLANFLDPHPNPDLKVDEALLHRYEGALHIVDPQDPEALTNCFTSAYGRSPVRSGSYLATPEGVRRFSPTEILRLLGFPPSFRLPEDLPRRKAWQLAGNSLSLAAVRIVLGKVPPLAGTLSDSLVDESTSQETQLKV